jgi:coenzyme F420-reducing hydrogenase delta subunit
MSGKAEGGKRAAAAGAAGTEAAETGSAKKLKILGFLCNWCSYAGADLAGVSRMQYPDEIRIIRVPCSGRINPLLVLKCFQEGADGVLVSGCHPGDCHYQEGNLYARRRMLVLRSMLSYFGIDERRFHVSWVSASEGRKWADTVERLVRDVRAARTEAKAGVPLW